MKTAKQIMKGKISIKDDMEKQFQNSDELWRMVEVRLNNIMNKYPDLPKGVHMHTDNYIRASTELLSARSDIRRRSTSGNIRQKNLIRLMFFRRNTSWSVIS